MRKTTHALAACLLLSGLAACGRTDPPAAPTAVSQPGAATVESKGESVALPPAAVPQPAAATPPAAAAPTPTVPDSASPSQANPKTLDTQQESTAMPMPGQVNNHSTPQPIDKAGSQPK